MMNKTFLNFGIRVILTTSFFLFIWGVFRVNIFSAIFEIILTYLFWKDLPGWMNWTLEHPESLIPASVKNLLSLGMLFPFYTVYAHQYTFSHPYFIWMFEFEKYEVSLPKTVILFWSLILVTVPFGFLLNRWLLNLTIRFFKSFTRFERIYFLLGFSILTSLLVCVSSQTSFWLAPTIPDCPAPNHFFGADTSVFSFDRFSEFRHPFYDFVLLITSSSVFVFSKLASLFSPLGVTHQTWGFAIVQIIQFVLCGIFLSRACSQCVSASFCKYAAILWLSSFTFVWCFVPERTIPSLFWLLCAVNLYHFSDSGFWKKLFVSLLAIGSCTMSWALISFLLIQKAGNQIVSHVFHRTSRQKILIPWSGIFFLCLFPGYLLQTFKFGEKYNVPATSLIQLTNNAFQYGEFINGIFIPPTWKSITLTTSGKPFSILPKPFMEVSGCSRISALILVLLMCISIWRFYPDFFVQTAAIWLLVSFGILILMGFGAKEQTMTLYSPYFAWAFFPLSVLWLGELEKKWGMWISFPLILLALTFFVANLRFVFEVTNLMKEVYTIPCIELCF